MMKFSLSIFLIFFVVLSADAAEKSLTNNQPFMLLSPAFEQGQELPTQYTCKGSDINPPLEIYNPPAKTKSIAITVQNVDAPEGVWTHWVVYNIPPDKLSIFDNRIPGSQLLNDFGKYTYAGPCPLDDQRERRFVFTAYALSKKIEENESWTVQDLERAMKGSILAKYQLIAKSH